MSYPRTPAFPTWKRPLYTKTDARRALRKAYNMGHSGSILQARIRQAAVRYQDAETARRLILLDELVSS